MVYFGPALMGFLWFWYFDNYFSFDSHVCCKFWTKPVGADHKGRLTANPVKV